MSSKKRGTSKQHPVSNPAPEQRGLRYDPEAALPASVPWPVDYTCILVEDDFWTPSEAGSFVGTCPRCRGRHQLRGADPCFCPFCGHNLENGAIDPQFVPLGAQ